MVGEGHTLDQTSIRLRTLGGIPARREQARQAAEGQDVRIGGGPTIIRDFLTGRLVDHMHIVVVPRLLGRGVRLLHGLEGLENEYQVEATSSPSGVTHVTFTRAAARCLDVLPCLEMGPLWACLRRQPSYLAG